MRRTMPPEGTTRIVRRFLWLPMTFGCEIRWLEFARIEERVCPNVGGGFAEYVWQPQMFADGPEEADASNTNV